MNPENRSDDRTTAVSVLALATSRLFVQMTRRYAYPFLPEISRDLGVSLASVQGVVGSQAGVGMISPLFGGFSERYGRKRVILVSLLMMCLITLPGLLKPGNFSVFYAVMVAFGFAKVIFDPAMQAYIADRVSYRRRGMAIGVTELAWAGALMVAAPITGYLLEVNGLGLVYAMLLVVNSVGLMLVWVFVPPDHADGVIQRNVPSPLSWWRILLASPAALAALAYSLLLSIGNETLFIVYGEWMETTFNLKLAALGTATIVVAVAEVSGEFVVIGASDTIGKRRMALGAMLAASVMYAILPQLGFSLPVFLVGLFLLFLMFEMAVVASISIFTEVLPQARAVMMSSNAAAHSLGRFSGAFVGAFVYELGGFALAGVVSLVIGLLATGIMWRLITEIE